MVFTVCTVTAQYSVSWYGVHLSFIGVARGGSWGARDPRFCKPFLTKQHTTGGENAMTISWP